MSSDIFKDLIPMEELLLLLKKQYCRRTIYRWVDLGMPHKRIRSRLWFPKDEVIKWILSDTTIEEIQKEIKIEYPKHMPPSPTPVLKKKDYAYFTDKEKDELKKSLSYAKETIENLNTLKPEMISDCIDDIEIACCNILMKIKTERLNQFEEDK
jgi:hypothetical protein